MNEANVRLDSWKSIAAYLGRDVRTARRWERDRGLPVRRVPGGGSASVYAFTAELDAWLAAANTPAATVPADARPPDRARPWTRSVTAAAGIAALAVLVVVGGVLLRARLEPVATLDFSPTEIRAMSAGGVQRWSYALTGRLAEIRDARHWTPRADFDGDGHDEIVVGFTTHESGLAYEREHLVAFTQSGRRLWERTPDARVAFGGRLYEPPWAASDLLVYGTPPRAAWAVHHYTWWPSLVHIVDGRGAIVHTFAHPGWITNLAATADARLLLAGGYNNAHGRVALAVLDAADPDGSPPPMDPAFDCSSCADGRPLRYILFAPSELARVTDSRPRLPVVVRVLGPDAVDVHVMQNADRTAEAIVEFGADMTPRRVAFSDDYWDWHRRLEADRLIAHRADACPDRRGLDVSMWTPAEGWRTRFVPAR